MTYTTEDLREALDAGIALTPEGIERIRAAEQIEEAAADQIVADERAATIRYTQALEAVRATGEAHIAAARALVVTAKADIAARAEYTAAIRRARAAGLDVSDEYPRTGVRYRQNDDFRRLVDDLRTYGRL